MTAVTAGAQHYPFIEVTPHFPVPCLLPFQDSHGKLWLAGCMPGSEGLFCFDGTRYFSPLRGGELKGIVRGMAEDSDGGIWLSSTSGIYRFYKDRLERIVDGVAHAGITQVAPDVFLATIGMPGTDFLTGAKALRIARGDGVWKSETIMPSVSQTPFRLDHSGSVLYGCPGGFCEVQADAIVHWQPGATLHIG